MTYMNTKLLRDGIKMPAVGLGLWRANSRGNVKEVVSTAIECGYRLFDCATMYQNERELGEALRESGMKRDEYFVVSKLPEEGHGYDEARKEVSDSLRRLGLDYLDLHLIHSPYGGRNVDTWRALVDLQKEGKTRSIGVSNFNVHHLEGLAKAGLPVPVVNQIEIHPWLQQRQVVDYCRERDITLMAFCPLARCEKFDSCPLLDSLSRKHDRTKAQVLLRWSIQKDFVTIPKSSLRERQIENISLFDFELSKEDMDQLDTLECDMQLSRYTAKFMGLPWEG